MALLLLAGAMGACTAVPAVTHEQPTPTGTGATRTATNLSPEANVHVDLDGDGEDESVSVGRGPRGIRIDDGGVVYRSRAKWVVLEAALGDTDRDGLPEVVALLEDEEGVHVGLFAWRGGAYRERLVTSPIVPRPSSLDVRHDAASGGDVLDLGEGAAGVSTYRWNGFGFTLVEGVGAGR